MYTRSSRLTINRKPILKKWSCGMLKWHLWMRDVKAVARLETCWLTTMRLFIKQPYVCLGTDINVCNLLNNRFSRRDFQSFDININTPTFHRRKGQKNSRLRLWRVAVAVQWRHFQSARCIPYCTMYHAGWGAWRFAQYDKKSKLWRMLYCWIYDGWELPQVEVDDGELFEARSRVSGTC